jgi:cell division protein FtsQ
MSNLCSSPVTPQVPPIHLVEKSHVTPGHNESWRLSRPCSGVANQGNTTNRPLLWDDDPPAAIRSRRTREDASQPGQFRSVITGRRALPGMPLEFDDPDGDGVLHPTVERFGAPKRSWWRPASTVGRVFLTLGALIVLSGLTTAGLLLMRYLERDARFLIAGTSHIQTTGLTEVTRAQMLPVFGEDIGRNVFFVPLSERRRELEKIPWIKQATVMRVLPDQIRIAVVERKPVAFTRTGAQIGLVDANGVLLTMPARTMAERHYSFPVLTGIDPGDPAESRKARMAVYLRLMAELDADGKHNSEQISEIDLTDPEDARVLIPEQGADILAHFGEDHFLERYQRYQAHIAEWRQQYPHLASVDLRYDQQVVLQMASGKETSDTNAGGDAGAINQPAAAITPGLVAVKPTAGTARAIKKMSKPAQTKKRATGPPRRTAALNTRRRNPASTTRPAAVLHPRDHDLSPPPVDPSEQRSLTGGGSVEAPAGKHGG